MKPITSKHRPRVGSAERWHRECKSRDTILQSLHHCSHRPPSIDPGSGQQRGGTLRVSALHYSAGDRVAGGFRTVASAHALSQPTSCRSEYFYNQRPRVWNLIGTEHSLIEVSIGLRRKQAKSNSIDGFQNTEVFPIDLDFGL